MLNDGKYSYYVCIILDVASLVFAKNAVKAFFSFDIYNYYRLVGCSALLKLLSSVYYSVEYETKEIYELSDKDIFLQNVKNTLGDIYDIESFNSS